MEKRLHAELIIPIFVGMLVVSLPSVSSGDHLFDPPVNYDVGDLPRSVAASNLDEDEDGDLAVSMKPRNPESMNSCEILTRIGSQVVPISTNLL
jgi:hypothetical protein